MSKELQDAYEKYIKLIEDHDRSIMPLLHAHGYKTPEVEVERGQELRELITKLKQDEAGTV